MAGNLKKFVNLRFIKTIDLALVKPLLARHAGKYEGFSQRETTEKASQN